MQIEFEGRIYQVRLSGDEKIVSIAVKTKSGWRTLGGYGRAARMREWARVAELAATHTRIDRDDNLKS